MRRKRARKLHKASKWPSKDLILAFGLFNHTRLPLGCQIMANGSHLHGLVEVSLCHLWCEVMLRLEGELCPR